MSRFKKTVGIIGVVIICFVALGGYGCYHFFYDINAIKPQEKIAESISPSGEYTINVYLNNGGASTSYSVLCVLSHNSREKNIYWSNRCESADIEWIDNDTVIINGIKLENIEKDTFDYRRIN